MGQKCIIKSCTNASYKKENSELLFHRFPTNAIHRERWIINIQTLANQIGRIPQRAVIWSEHFEKDVYIQKPDGKICLSRTAEPTLFRVESQSHSDSFMNIEKLSNSPQYRRRPLSVVQSESPARDWGLNNISSAISGSNPRSIPVSIRGNCNSKCDNKSETSGSKLVSVPDNCDSQPDNTPSSVSGNVNPGCKVNRIRYPGDIVDMARMSRRQLENCVQILLIKSVIGYYIKIRCFHLAKEQNIRDVYVRKKLTKLIHFKNQ